MRVKFITESSLCENTVFNWIRVNFHNQIIDDAVASSLKLLFLNQFFIPRGHHEEIKIKSESYM